jgi:hypothetical protein
VDEILDRAWRAGPSSPGPRARCRRRSHGPPPARASTSGNDAMITWASSGLGSSFTVISRITASNPRARGERQQVVARRVKRRGAEVHDIALDRDGAHLGDVAP